MHERHGYSYKRLYAIWKRMLQRCLNPFSDNYKNYGGRGITVCLEWREFIPFKNWALANGYFNDLTLERKDNNEDYCPDNCCWTTQAGQMRNTRRNIWLTAFGETKLQKEWIDDPRCVTSATTFKHRIKQGWDVERALTKHSLKTGKGS